MARESEVPAKLRERLDEIDHRLAELTPEVEDARRLEELRAAARVVRERLQAVLAQGMEVTEESLRSLGRGIEHLAERLRALREQSGPGP